MSWRKSLQTFFVIVSLSLAGCAISHPDSAPLPSMTFEHLEPINVAVSSIQIGQPDEVPGHAGHIRRFIVPPDEAVNTYLVRRFIPGGIKGKLKIDIEEAGVFHLRQPSSHEFNRFLGVGRTEEYNLVIKLNVTELDDAGQYRQSKRIKGTRRIRVSEHASLAKLEAAQFRGLESLLADMDAALVGTITDEFGL